MMKFLIIALLIVDIIIVLLFVLFMRRFLRKEDSQESIDNINELIHPLITEAKSVSYRLEGIIKEKQAIVDGLTEALDQKIAQSSRIIEKNDAHTSFAPSFPPKTSKSLTSTRLSRPSSPSKPSKPIKTANQSKQFKPGKVNNFKEFQDNVILLSNQGQSAEMIASQLNVNKKEVDLVLSLKKNIEQVKNISEDMENNGSFQEIDFKASNKNKTKTTPLIKDILQKKSKKTSKFPSGPPARKNSIAFNNSSSSDTINADEVLKLSKRGVKSEAIAKKMGVSKGEVDLVLGLKKKFQNIERNFNNINAYK